MQFSKQFNLGKGQAELDFVDVDPRKDTRLFLDPYALEIKQDAWSQECGDHIRSFFEEVIAALRSGDDARAIHLVGHLHEPADTYLGLSKGRPSGRGVGRFQASQLLRALRQSSAFETGMLADLAEAELLIEGIGPDKISDLTTNVVRGPLSDYTQEQCALLGVPTRKSASPPIWNPETADWESRYVDVPFVGINRVLLVPKYSVRRRPSLDSQEFYNHHMVNFLQEEYLEAGSGLVRVLRNGNRRVYKKDVKERHPFVKDNLANFIRKHPEVLDAYKTLKGAEGALDNKDLDEEFDERAFAQALRQTLAQIPAGTEGASSYHSLMIGILTYVFYPDLIRPIKEKEIHEGRKRIDIVYTNAATRGFFHRMLAAPQTRSVYVMVECKNYSDDIANPEIDQLAGRFGHQRGFLGILACRSINNRDAVLKRCRDTVQDSRGYIVTLEDSDIDMMLAAISAGNRTLYNRYLDEKFQALVS